MPRTIITPDDIAELSARAYPIAYRFPKAGDDNGHHFVENIVADEPSKLEAVYDARVLELARDLCLRVGSEHSANAALGKLGSIKRNRNNWKADAAFLCADKIDALMQSLIKTPA